MKRRSANTYCTYPKQFQGTLYVLVGHLSIFCRQNFFCVSVKINKIIMYASNLSIDCRMCYSLFAICPTYTTIELGARAPSHLSHQHHDIVGGTYPPTYDILEYDPTNTFFLFISLRYEYFLFSSLLSIVLQIQIYSTFESVYSTLVSICMFIQLIIFNCFYTYCCCL